MQVCRRLTIYTRYRMITINDMVLGSCGADGTSHRYVAVRAAKLLGRPLETLKLITLHLGAGSSITAIDHGQSLDTLDGIYAVSLALQWQRARAMWIRRWLLIS